MTTDTEARAGDGAHPAGVWRALSILALAASFAWVPYVVPGLEDLRVLAPDDPAPLSRLIAPSPRRGARIAGALRRATIVSEDDDALMRAAPLPASIEIAPRASRRRPPGQGDDERAQAPLARVDPGELEGLTRRIEDPHGSMRAFHRRLAKVARGQRVLARMSVYGTSTNGADRTTGQLRRLLQARFGDGGKGWVPAAPGWRYQRHQHVEWRAQHFRTFVVNRSDGPLDRYGFGGVVAINRHHGARATFGTVRGDGPGSAVSVLRVFHQAWPDGGTLRLRVDDGPERELSTRADAPEDRVETIRVADGAHTLTLSASGDGQEDLRLYGVVMERDGPGVVVDGLALIGAFTRVLRLFDEEHIATQIRQRDPNLLVFWMGANDAVSSSVPFVREQYAAHYRGILRRFSRARPETSCLVMSILDKGERQGSRIRTRARVPEMVAVQREVALAEGCAFFDTFEATGGDGTMGRWYAASPRLVTADLGHLTDAGSRVMGTLLYRALLASFDDWIADGEPAPGER